MSGSPRSSYRFVLAALVGLVGPTVDAAIAHASERRPVAAVTIYPGEIIREQMLTDADFPNVAPTGVFASNHAMLIGKVAKRTLLAGYAIPTNSIGVPRLVSVGAMVRLVYEESGLQISTYASALQNGAAGDVISVRNLESGVTVTGTIQADGTIHVGPG